jgi:hypothetical protein
MKIRREECLIIGGMRGVHGRAGFDRAPLVLECRGGRYIVPRITQAELLEGEPMTDEEWRGVLASEEALEFSERQRAAPNAFLWLMRRNFSFRDHAVGMLEGRGAVLYKEVQEDTMVLLVDEVAASGLPHQWSGQAWNQAWAYARAERLDQAVEQAELSMCLVRGLLVDHVAFLSLLYERQGDKEGAEAMLELARNSRGDAFYERACEKKERFARELSIVSAPAPRRPRFGPKKYRRRDAALSESIDRLRDDRFLDKDAA